MKKLNDLKYKMIEGKLSEFSALASLASERINEIRALAEKTDEQLKHLQSEIENLYIILDEPFLISSNTLKDSKQIERNEILKFKNNDS